MVAPSHVGLVPVARYCHLSYCNCRPWWRP